MLLKIAMCADNCYYIPVTMWQGANLQTIFWYYNAED